MIQYDAKGTRLELRRKKKTSTGPKILKSGYWQESDEEDAIDIFEWFAAGDLQDEPPATLSGVREVAAFTAAESMLRLNSLPSSRAPEYRPPPMRAQLQKGLKSPLPVDQDGQDHVFADDIAREVTSFSNGSYSLEDVDVVVSLSGLRMLMGFVDGSMAEDFRAKGMHTHFRHEPQLLDLMRIVRINEAPGVVALATVWNWLPANATNNVGLINKLSYDSSFEKLATGQGWSGGPPSVRYNTEDIFYRLLEYECGGLKMVVRAPAVATVPSVDADAFERPGQAVALCTANRRDVGDLWDWSLSSTYAEMQLGDVGMIVRGIVNKGTLVDLQEITQEDLRLDRPAIVDEAARLVGRLAGLLRRIREVAACPGCRDRPLYLQYADAELRIISPRFEEDYYVEEEEDGESGIPELDPTLPYFSSVGISDV